MMLVGNDDHLGLSLSLVPSSGVDGHHHHRQRLPLQLNLMPPSPEATEAQPFVFHHKNHWSDAVVSSDRETTRSRFLRGIDVNRAPAKTTAVVDLEEEEEEGVGVSSPNSTVSSVSGGAKRSSAEREGFFGGNDKIGVAGDENETERASSSRGMSDDEDGGEHSRKKLRLSKDQSAVLEESFKEHSTLNPDEIEADGGGLRVPKEVLRESDGGESEAAEGGARAEGAEDVPSVLHADDTPDDAHHVPFLREGLLLRVLY
ncbi:Homeobox-leucine zipper protein HAT1 [Acorus gramineus]|uniref:Homeobox-leucine zipper protein HAT1 n=1 Tax=Acorus gramineus TaxID=55184 RepID=A0AAV9BBY9_ACOGR|nr:Homeobox-leucine zipper protein HAT1 [Acorus gramineus]